MQLQTLNTSAEQHLKHTTSLCPVCRAQVPAEVVQRGSHVVMKKQCNNHGSFEATLSTDDRFYHLSLGNDAEAASTGCCCTAGASRGSPALSSV